MVLRPEDLYHAGIVGRCRCGDGWRQGCGRVSIHYYGLQRRAAVPKTARPTRHCSADECPDASANVRELSRLVSGSSTRFRLPTSVRPGDPGSVWTPSPRDAVHHRGYVVDDLAKRSAEIESRGWEREVCGLGDGTPAVFAYYRDLLGIRVELVDRAISRSGVVASWLR